MQFLVPAIVIAYVAGLFATRGDAVALLAMAFVGLICQVAVGALFERRAWPFTRPGALWPFRVIGIVSSLCAAGFFNQHVLPVWTILAYLAALAVVTVIAWRRNWYLGTSPAQFIRNLGRPKDSRR